MRIALFCYLHRRCNVSGRREGHLKILGRLGREVVFPSRQACCGQMHVNSGYLKEAVPVVANHVAAFDTVDYDVAVAPPVPAWPRSSTSTRWWPAPAGDAALEARATAVGAKTYELSELLVECWA